MGAVGRLVVMGTGDVTTRYVIPALAELLAGGDLPDGFTVDLVSRHDVSDDELAEMVNRALDDRGDADDATRDALLAMVGHHRADATDADALAPVVGGDRPVAVYLALPAPVFPDAVGALATVGLPAGSRVVFEKPFGTDLSSAVELNEKLRRCLPDDDVFRVDHFLGKQTVQLLLGIRFANRVFEAAWSAEHVERVDIVWDETLALEGRAGFYDRAGALRDMIQNHLMQLFCLVAMEPPGSLEPDEVADRKIEVLDATRPFHADLACCSTRARYTAGTVDGEQVVAYAESEGVDPERRTETLASVTLGVDTDRWRGVPFTLRSGKALASDRHEVVVTFRSGSHPAADGARNEVRVAVKPDRVGFELVVGEGSDALRTRPVDLVETLDDSPLGAYSVLLCDVIAGRSNRSVRAAEVEAAWRVLTPFLDAFATDAIPLEDYPAGSHGP